MCVAMTADDSETRHCDVMFLHWLSQSVSHTGQMATP